MAEAVPPPRTLPRETWWGCLSPSPGLRAWSIGKLHNLAWCIKTRRLFQACWDVRRCESLPQTMALPIERVCVCFRDQTRTCSLMKYKAFFQASLSNRKKGLPWSWNLITRVLRCSRATDPIAHPLWCRWCPLGQGPSSLVLDIGITRASGQDCACSWALHELPQTRLSLRDGL